MFTQTTSPEAIARKTSATVTNVRECDECSAIVGTFSRPSGGLMTVTLNWTGAAAGAHDEAACKAIYWGRPSVNGLARTDARPVFDAEGSVESLEYPDGVGGRYESECSCTDPYCGA